MSEQRRWTLYWCEHCGFREFAQAASCPHCGRAPYKRLELVLASDLEAAERRVEEAACELEEHAAIILSEGGENPFARLRSALSTTEEPARGT